MRLVVKRGEGNRIVERGGSGDSEWGRGEAKLRSKKEGRIMERGVELLSRVL